jgi:trehalose/maltose hydrolase-like predicted phosphorylase
MKNYLKHHPWQIIEENFHPEFHQVSESIYSLGNGRFGGRGNFEEDYSGEMLPGSISQVSTIRIKPESVGGKMVIPNILQKS